MIILGVDTETTGRDPKGDQVVELGLVLFDTDKNSIINQFGRILRVSKWDVEAERKHKISRQYCDLVEDLPSDPWDIISGNACELIVAHNAPFDYPFITERWPSFLKKDWLCTWQDLNHDVGLDRKGGDSRTGRLAYLAIEYGIPVTGWHRALGDAEFCCRIAARHDLKAALERKKLPKFKLVITGSWNAKNIEWCKANRFRWDPEIKQWGKEDLIKDEMLILAPTAQENLPGWNVEIAKFPPRPY